MHGYYYDQNRVYPEEMGDSGRKKGRRPRRPGRAVLLFCAALALLIIAAVVLHWVGDTLEHRDTLSQSSAGQQEGQGGSRNEEEKRGETTVERAPLGDQVTMTLNPRPQTEPHTLQYHKSRSSPRLPRWRRWTGCSLHRWSGGYEARSEAGGSGSW